MKNNTSKFQEILSSIQNVFERAGELSQTVLPTSQAPLKMEINLPKRTQSTEDFVASRQKFKK